MIVELSCPFVPFLCLSCAFSCVFSVAVCACVAFVLFGVVLTGNEICGPPKRGSFHFFFGQKKTFTVLGDGELTVPVLKGSSDGY